MSNKINYPLCGVTYNFSWNKKPEIENFNFRKGITIDLRIEKRSDDFIFKFKNLEKSQENTCKIQILVYKPNQNQLASRKKHEEDFTS